MGDFNGDGKPDVAVANIGTYDENPDKRFGSNLSILLNNGDGTFQPPVNYLEDQDPSSLAVSDFNNDGKPDIAVANGSGNALVLFGNGDGTFASATPYNSGRSTFYVTAGDFNGDRNSDLVIVNNGAGSVTILLNACAPRVSLAVARAGDAITISWPLPATGFVLESTTNLGPLDWRAVTDTPATNAGNLQITIPATNAAQRYFRLHKP